MSTIDSTSTFTPRLYVRNPSYVEAAQVTANNIEEIADWCGGVILGRPDANRYIKVKVLHALNERQTQAFFGDWVLKSEKRDRATFRVYAKKAFDLCYSLTQSEIDKMGPEDESPLFTQVLETVHLPATEPVKFLDEAHSEPFQEETVEGEVHEARNIELNMGPHSGSIRISPTDLDGIFRASREFNAGE